ncbi:hypothetical protein V8E55_010020, partial [Tylopilus felleus]
WKSRILSTLSLWAGAQSNIWTTPKESVVSTLIIVIPMVLVCWSSVYFVYIGTAYQYLCKWRHSVGSAVLTLCMSFSFELKVEERHHSQTSEFLKDNSFLYEDLNSSNPQKVFLLTLSSVYLQ